MCPINGSLPQKCVYQFQTSDETQSVNKDSVIEKQT